MAKRERKPPADVPAILGSVGIDWICDRMLDGVTLTGLAKELNISRSAIQRWIDADEVRSARAREARIASSSAWDEKAEVEIRDAKDAFELQKARELAHHYRWRAAKIDPGGYGEKKEPEKSETDVTITGGLPE